LVPQAPQWSGLLKGFTHAPSQQTLPVPHAGVHPPPEPPELPPLDVLLPELPLELVEDPELLVDPLELLEPDEDEVVPSSPELSAEASVEPPELNVDPPHAAAIAAAPRNDQDSASACFIEFPSPGPNSRPPAGTEANGCPGHDAAK
jgi:hypothetical protein